MALAGISLAIPHVDPLLASAIQTTAQAEQAHVYVTGYVAHPGPYTLEDDMTVETLVERAGGFARQESHKLVVVRVVDGKMTWLVAKLDTPLQTPIPSS